MADNPLLRRGRRRKTQIQIPRLRRELAQLPHRHPITRFRSSTIDHRPSTSTTNLDDPPHSPASRLLQGRCSASGTGFSREAYDLVFDLDLDLDLDLQTQKAQSPPIATWVQAERRFCAVGRAAWMRRERRQDMDADALDLDSGPDLAKLKQAHISNPASESPTTLNLPPNPLLRIAPHVHPDPERRHRTLLQRLGHRPADRLLPWLAARRRRMGCANALPRPERLPRHRPRPPRPRSLRPDLGRQRHGHLCRRPRRTVRSAGPQRRHHDRPLHRRRRSRPLHRPPWHCPRRQSRADWRRTADHAENRGQPRRPADGRLRRHPRRLHRRPLAILQRPRQREHRHAHRTLSPRNPVARRTGCHARLRRGRLRHQRVRALHRGAAVDREGRRRLPAGAAHQDRRWQRSQIGAFVQSEAVADAEVVAVGRDKADADIRRLGHPPVARRPGSRLGGVHQGVALGDTLAHLLTGEERLGAAVLAYNPQWHFFDEGDVDAAINREGHQVVDLVIVAPLHHHAVQFGALKACRVGGVDPGNDLAQVTGAGQFLETRRVEAVQADVQALEAGFEQWHCQLVELRAVGGHAQFAQAGQGSDAAAQSDDTGTHQRLTAGEANLFGAQRNEALSHLMDFFEREDLLTRQEGHFLGHAIHAAEIAAISDRQADRVAWQKQRASHLHRRPASTALNLPGSLWFDDRRLGAGGRSLNGFGIGHVIREPDENCTPHGIAQEYSDEVLDEIGPAQGIGKNRRRDHEHVGYHVLKADGDEGHDREPHAKDLAGDLATGQNDQNQANREYGSAQQVTQRGPLRRDHGADVDVQQKAQGDERASQKTQHQNRRSGHVRLLHAGFDGDLGDLLGSIDGHRLPGSHAMNGVATV
nr:hypothetical protein [Tanacetum cinerariifolium]